MEQSNPFLPPPGFEDSSSYLSSSFHRFETFETFHTPLQYPPLRFQNFDNPQPFSTSAGGSFGAPQPNALSYPTLPIEGFGDGARNLFPPDSMEETQRMIAYLCHVTKFARDVEGCEKRAGGNNNVILFSCVPLSGKYNGQRICCILRTRRRNWFKTTPPTDEHMKNSVAATHFFREVKGLPIPSTLVWDCTYENHIQSPYLIQECAAGDTLEAVYDKLSRGLKHTKHPRNPHLERRCKIARSVAKVMADIDKTELEGYGVFGAHVNMPNKGSNLYADFEICRDHVHGNVGTKIPTAPVFSDWVNNILNAQMEKCSDISLNLSPEEIGKIQKLRQIGTQMKAQGLFEDQPAVLWHNDFYPRNIMVKNTRHNSVLTAVIDWDEAVAFPRIVTRQPPSFLWEMEDSPLLHEEMVTIRLAFKAEMEVLRPGYMDDADIYVRALIRALCIYAMFGPSYKYHHEVSFYDLSSGWDTWMESE